MNLQSYFSLYTYQGIGGIHFFHVYFPNAIDIIFFGLQTNVECVFYVNTWQPIDMLKHSPRHVADQIKARTSSIYHLKQFNLQLCIIGFCIPSMKWENLFTVMSLNAWTSYVVEMYAVSMKGYINVQCNIGLGNYGHYCNNYGWMIEM